MIPVSAFKLLKRLSGQWLCLAGCVLPMWGQTELWPLMIHNSVWWVGGLPIEMADGHARLAPCAMPPTAAIKSGVPQEKEHCMEYQVNLR